MAKEEVDPLAAVDRLVAFLKCYPVDLMIGIMKDMKCGYPSVYAYAIENEAFVQAYFESYGAVR